MRILSQHDEQQLLSAIPVRSAFGAREKAQITLALATGLRAAELVGLRVEQVCGDKPGGGRMVRHRLALPAELAKGGRPRVIPLNDQAREAVLAILVFNRQRGFSVAPEAPLFPNRQHRAMSTRALRRVLEKHSQRADLDQAVSPHSLRHTFGSRLIERGANVPTTRVLMGHVRLSSTQRYVHSSPAQLAAAVGRLVRA